MRRWATPPRQRGGAMSEPKRYTAHDEYVFYDDDGEFVSYKDYAALRAQLTTAERERDEARREREEWETMVGTQRLVLEGLHRRAERAERVVEAARAFVGASRTDNMALLLNNLSSAVRALDASGRGDG